eukprot:2758010-Rhodomonas_salina.1
MSALGAPVERHSFSSKNHSSAHTTSTPTDPHTMPAIAPPESLDEDEGFVVPSEMAAETEGAWAVTRTLRASDSAVASRSCWMEAASCCAAAGLAVAIWVCTSRAIARRARAEAEEEEEAEDDGEEEDAEEDEEEEGGSARRVESSETERTRTALSAAWASAATLSRTVRRSSPVKLRSAISTRTVRSTTLSPPNTAHVLSGHAHARSPSCFARHASAVASQSWQHPSSTKHAFASASTASRSAHVASPGTRAVAASKHCLTACRAAAPGHVSSESTSVFSSHTLRPLSGWVPSNGHVATASPLSP